MSLPLTLSTPQSPTTPWIVTWLTWPLLFVAAVGGTLAAIAHGLNYSASYAIFLVATAALLVVLETLFPLSGRWRMTWPSFRRDLKYLVAGLVTIAGVNAAFGLLSIQLGSGNTGPISDWPLYLGVPAALLTVDFLQYWQHRWSHELGGPLGRFLWRTHAAHHLPDRVYVVMHVVAHPVNLVIVRGLTMLVPLYYLGASAETVLLFNVIGNLQGLLSHCNVDIRAGWLNYIFVGTELHRYHHSADPDDAKNYAVTLSLLDVVFGTFRYRPGTPPDRLGVAEPADYPDSNEFWKVMKLPFTRA